MNNNDPSINDLIKANSELQDKCKELEQELDYCKGCLNAILTGNMPERASLEQFSLALQGRKIARLLKAKQ